jgi:FixJ family two-component response regulator
MVLGESIVIIVDDDASVRDALKLLIESAGGGTETFDSGREFLRRRRLPAPSCLVLDVCLPDFNGLVLQSIVADQTELPIIFITGHGDIPTSVRAMRAGAIEFLTKPFSDEAMLAAVRGGLDRSRAALGREAEMRALRAEYGALTERERQVMTLVASGLLNKQVSRRLGISEVTVKAHRGNVMRKMAVDSLAELVRKATKLGVSSPPSA